MEKTAIISIGQKVLSGIIFLFAFFIGASATVSISEGAQSNMINGTYVLSLPMPGGAKDSTISFVSDGEKVTGAMSAPGNPSLVSPIKDGRYTNGRLSFSAVIGRITYLLDGSFSGETLKFDMTTLEVIPLDNGSRLSGKTGDITGTYKVPVYSPGGVKENKFELSADKGVIAGEMYSLGGNSSPPEGMGGDRGNAGPPPGAAGAGGGAPAGAGMNASADGKQDLNKFYDGTYKGNSISLFTKTAQGSIFHFTGAIDGDIIKLSMEVTDKRSGIEAKKK